MLLLRSECFDLVTVLLMCDTMHSYSLLSQCTPLALRLVVDKIISRAIIRSKSTDWEKIILIEVLSAVYYTNCNYEVSEQTQN